jgi:hypothetical protein
MLLISLWRNGPPIGNAQASVLSVRTVAALIVSVGIGAGLGALLLSAGVRVAAYWQPSNRNVIGAALGGAVGGALYYAVLGTFGQNNNTGFNPYYLAFSLAAALLYALSLGGGIALSQPAGPSTAEILRTTPQTALRRPSRRRSLRVSSAVFGLLGLIIIPWSIYANQDAQRVQCVGYKVIGHRPLPWTITCFLNGNL